MGDDALFSAEQLAKLAIPASRRDESSGLFSREELNKLAPKKRRRWFFRLIERIKSYVK